MKKSVLWLLCIFPVFCNAQFVATPTGMHAATGVDDVVYGMDVWTEKLLRQFIQKLYKHYLLSMPLRKRG